jgi:hypothetical protein
MATDNHFVAESGLGDARIGFSTNINTIEGFEYGAKVQGSSCGVAGESDDGLGVWGHSKTNFGVEGRSEGHGGTGVHGHSTNTDGIGVKGDCEYGTGVVGDGAFVGVLGVSGVSETRGTATFRAGVRGVCGGEDGVGVYGESKTGIGVVAEARNSKYEALFATNDGGGLAASFVGGLQIVAGSLTVFGGLKSAAVPHPDGLHRLLYCVESPESWFEDFGEAKLVKGRAKVRIDPDFAVVADTRHSHVFLTPYGDSRGLYVSARHRHEFEVREQGRGSSSLTFSYRVVAKRKDVTAERFKKVTLPQKPKVSTRLKPPNLGLPPRKSARGTGAKLKKQV